MTESITFGAICLCVFHMNFKQNENGVHFNYYKVYLLVYNHHHLH